MAETNNSTEFYIDNIMLHIKGTQKNLGSEIPSILIFSVLSFFSFTCLIKIIYHFNPIYYMVNKSLYSFIIYLCIILVNDNYNEYCLIQNILLEISYIISLIGYGIYLELIELRFCGLDKY